MAALADIIDSGAVADRPAAGSTGALYFATDEGKIYRDNGTTWDDVTPTVSGTGGSTDHGALTGLDGDDHPQYTTDAEAGVIADASVATHEGAADPHTGYQKESEKAAANGYASLDSTGKVPAAQLPAETGTVSAQGTYLVSGGQVVWQTGLQFLVQAGSSYIDGTLETWAQQTVTLDAADATDPRIDVIGVDSTSTVFKTTGTPAASPSEPVVSPDTQLKLALVTVAAGATSPTVTSELVYAENAGSGGGPAEWDWTQTAGSGWTFDNTTTPRTGTNRIQGATLSSGATARAQRGSGTIDPGAYSHLLLYLRFTSAWNASRYLTVWLANAGVKKGNALRISGGYFGLDAANTTDYQVVAIPTLQLAVPAGTLVDQIFLQDVGGSISFGIDDVSWLSVDGSSGTVGGGIDQATADARYAQRANNLSDLTSASTARSNIGAMAATTVLNSIPQATGNVDLNAQRIIDLADPVDPQDAATMAYVDAEIAGVVGGGGMTDPMTTIGDMIYRDGTNATARLPRGTAGQALVYRGGTPLPTPEDQVSTLNFLIDGGGSEIADGIKGDLVVDFACEIISVTLLADQSGSIVVDIWKDSYANYPPTDGDTITSATPPTITTAEKSQDTTLTTWTKTIAAGQVLRFNVDSCTTITRATVAIKVRRT